MNIDSPRRKALVDLIALAGLTAITDGVHSDWSSLYGVGLDKDSMQQRESELLGGPNREPWAPILAPEDWFKAFATKDSLPAEFLALGDGSLDVRPLDF